MTQKEMIELVQQHHPHMGEKEVRGVLNRVSDVFCAETELIKKSWTAVTTAGVRYYPLDDDMIRIIDVRLNDEKLPRLVTPPPIEDEDYT